MKSNKRLKLKPHQLLFVFIEEVEKIIPPLLISLIKFQIARVTFHSLLLSFYYSLLIGS